jgi:hypothetical protein
MRKGYTQIISQPFWNTEMAKKDFLEYVQSKPTGKYARRLWFLYEFLTRKPLALEDVEGPNPENYDQTSFTAFCKMLIEIGFNITFCPYENSDYWTGSLNILNFYKAGAVKWWNLQCYAGGAGNNPNTWTGYITSAIPTFNTDGYILASDWSRNYNSVDKMWQGDCVPAFKSLMKSFKGEKSVGGGFLWNIDQVEEYAEEIRKYPAPQECSSSDRSLADYISAITSGLGL